MGPTLTADFKWESCTQLQWVIKRTATVKLCQLQTSSPGKVQVVHWTAHENPNADVVLLRLPLGRQTIRILFRAYLEILWRRRQELQLLRPTARGCSCRSRTPSAPEHSRTKPASRPSVVTSCLIDPQVPAELQCRVHTSHCNSCRDATGSTNWWNGCSLLFASVNVASYIAYTNG